MTDREGNTNASRVEERKARTGGDSGQESSSNGADTGDQRPSFQREV
jgi:hypothetical protein